MVTGAPGNGGAPGLGKGNGAPGSGAAELAAAPLVNPLLPGAGVNKGFKGGSPPNIEGEGSGDAPIGGAPAGADGLGRGMSGMGLAIYQYRILI